MVRKLDTFQLVSAGLLAQVVNTCKAFARELQTFSSLAYRSLRHNLDLDGSIPFGKSIKGQLGVTYLSLQPCNLIKDSGQCPVQGLPLLVWKSL